MRQMKQLVAVFFAVSLTFSLASCSDKTVTRQAAGDPKLVIRGADGKEELDIEQFVDFGPALLNSRVERKVTIRNDGRAPFQVVSITRGDKYDDSFRYQFEAAELEVGQSRDFSFFFEPATEGDKVTDLTFDITNGTVEKLNLHLKGRAVKGGCTIEPAEQVDFGSVATGTSFVKLLNIKNSSDLDWTVTIGGISSQSDQGTFAFASGFVPGKFTVPAHDGIAVPIEFKPNHVGAHTAFLSIPDPSMCQPAVLPLMGSGVDQVLVWEPDTVDFGFVNPNTRVTSKVTFKNLGNKDVTVSGLAVVNPAGKEFFSLDSTLTTILVAKGGGKVEVPLAFKPTLLGGHSAKLNFATDDAKLATGAVNLRGFGGGPDIEVTPGKVDFGPVAIGTFQWRRLTIANVGTDAPGTADDNLLLGEKDPATGKIVEKKAVLTEITSPGAGEFVIEWPPQGYVTGTGLSAGSNADLRIKFTPKSSGTKEAKVTIYSNDPDEAVTEITVVAGGKTMPPCDYDVIPPQLKFGNVENTKNLVLPFYIRNKATNVADECLVSTLGLSRGTSNAYSLVRGVITGQIIPGGGQLEIPVKFAPTANGTYTGAVEFYISSPTAPEGKVTLSGSSQAACLLIAPNDLDFGVVQTNCSSRDRSFTLYNVCPSTITLTGIDVQSGLSTEFLVKLKPVLPYTLAAGSSVDFTAKYRPTDVGQDSGSIAIQTAQLTQPYVVTLTGRGATTAIQTDVFAQDSQPKVDVLIVIDDSCSMSDKQASLGKNFQSFIKFAVSQQVDYKIAVTTTAVCSSTPCSSWESSYANGRFLPLNGGRPTVITPNTPNKETVFQQNVNVGTSGSGSEELLNPIYLAFTAPNVTGPNANFLRDEAHLAIIIVSDAADQSSNTVAFYYNFILNIKGFRRANLTSVSGIIATLPSAPSGCSYDEPSAGQSTRTREIVTKTGGIYDDICTPDWSKTLEKLGQTAFGFRTRFFLTNQPDLSITPDPIDLKVDGVSYPSVGPRGDARWTYNSTANAIDFEPLAVPEPGSTLTVTYHVQCLP